MDGASPEPERPRRTGVGPAVEERAGRSSRWGSTDSRMLGLVVALLMAWSFVWNLAVPVLGAQQEAENVARYQATWTFQRVRPGAAPGQQGAPGVFVPGGGGPACYVNEPRQAASCDTTTRGTWEHRSTTIDTPGGSLLAPLLLGGPPTVWPGPGGVRFTRLLAALAGAVPLAAGVVLLVRRRMAMAVAGVVLATTPAALSSMATVDASGLRTGSAVLMWAALAAYLHDRKMGNRVVWGFAVGAVLLSLSALVGFVWVLVATALAVVHLGPSMVRRLLSLRQVIVPVGAGVAISLLVGTAGLLLRRAPPPRTQLSVTGAYTLVIGLSEHLWFRVLSEHNGWWSLQLWWTFLIGALVLTGLARGPARSLRTLLLLCGAAYLIPVTAHAFHYRLFGEISVARDVLPGLSGVLIVAGLLLEHPGVALRRPRFFHLLALVVTVVQVSSVWTALRRFAVGSAGPMWFGNWHGGWAPPVGPWAVLGAAVLLGALSAWLLVRWTAGADADGLPTGPVMAGTPTPRHYSARRDQG